MSATAAPTDDATAGRATEAGPVQTDVPGVIAAEEVVDDSSSDIESSIASSSTSVSSSIRGFREENGRTYHAYKDGKYNLPNDETENDRLDLQHNLSLLTLDNALGLAPPNKPGSMVQRVLDVGTGTGIWAIDFAEEHPDAEVVGVDLSPSMPSFVPPNVKFEIDDVEEEWTWSHPFDYIHHRFMNSAIGDWKAYAKRVFDNLAPGGYFEMQEVDLYPRSDDGTLKPDSALSKCIDFMGEASEKLGRPYQDVEAFVEILKDVGFVDVSVNLFKWPMNPWPKVRKYKELGIWNHENTMVAIEALTMAPFTRGLGWTKEEVLVFLVDVRKDLSNPQIHSYWAIYDIYARRPAEGAKK